MSLNHLPLTISRTGGCTLTGALAVTTSIQDGITIIHGPDGCAHHNFSLLHATLLDNDCMRIPRVMSSGLTEPDIVFGGEGALSEAISEAALEQPGMIFVLSTCITDTIGDDVAGICGNAGVPVCVIPTAGFLSGNFETGFSNALISISNIVSEKNANEGVSYRDSPLTINLVGEKNLEYEVEQNFAEIIRLISLLGLNVNLRFVHNLRASELDLLPFASLNVLREPVLKEVGGHLSRSFGTPYISSFPVGISGTLNFLRETAAVTGIPCEDAIEQEREYQRKMLDGFADLMGSKVFCNITRGSPDHPAIQELMDTIGLFEVKTGTSLPVPYPFPVGTGGIRRMLHSWRRSLA
jgi:nitrogenase molybdenum-iron protein alpha/beta subunit